MRALLYGEDSETRKKLLHDLWAKLAIGELSGKGALAESSRNGRGRKTITLDDSLFGEGEITNLLAVIGTHEAFRDGYKVGDTLPNGQVVTESMNKKETITAVLRHTLMAHRLGQTYGYGGFNGTFVADDLSRLYNDGITGLINRAVNGYGSSEDYLKIEYDYDPVDYKRCLYSADQLKGIDVFKPLVIKKLGDKRRTDWQKRELGINTAQVSSLLLATMGISASGALAGGGASATFLNALSSTSLQSIFALTSINVNDENASNKYLSVLGEFIISTALAAGAAGATKFMLTNQFVKNFNHKMGKSIIGLRNENGNTVLELLTGNNNSIKIQDFHLTDIMDKLDLMNDFRATLSPMNVKKMQQTMDLMGKKFEGMTPKEIIEEYQEIESRFLDDFYTYNKYDYDTVFEQSDFQPYKDYGQYMDINKKDGFIFSNNPGWINGYGDISTYYDYMRKFRDELIKTDPEKYFDYYFIQFE